MRVGYEDFHRVGVALEDEVAANVIDFVHPDVDLGVRLLLLQEGDE
jgi:hypothetical protein